VGGAVRRRSARPLQNLRLQRRGTFLHRPSAPASRSASKRPFQRLI
jgi:hypothetical protein